MFIDAMPSNYPKERKEFMQQVFDKNKDFNKIRGRSLNDVISDSSHQSSKSVAETDLCRLRASALKSIAGFSGYRKLEGILSRRVIARAENLEDEWKNKANDLPAQTVNPRSKAAREQRRDEAVAKREAGDRDETVQPVQWPQDTPVVIPLDSFEPEELKSIFETFHDGGGRLDWTPGFGGEPNRVVLHVREQGDTKKTKGKKGKEKSDEPQKMSHTLVDREDWLGYGLRWVNFGSWLVTVQGMPMDEVSGAIRQSIAYTPTHAAFPL